MLERARHKIPLLLLSAFAVAVAVHLILLARHAYLCLAHPFPIDYVEGVVCNWLRELYGGHSLYPALGAAPPYMHDPYTPLFYWLTAALQKALQTLGAQPHPFFAGRLLSLMAALTSGAIIFSFLRARAGRGAAFVCAALFLFSPITFRYGVMGRVDALALAFALGGLRAADAGRSWRGAALAGALCAGAFLTKPVYVIASLASLIVCGSRSRATAGAFLAALAAAIGLGFAAAYATRGTAIAAHLFVYNRLPLEFARLPSLLVPFMGKHAFLLAAIAMILISERRRRDAIWWYALLTPLFIPLSAKIGAEENYYLEILAAGALACGFLGTERSEDQTRNPELGTRNWENGTRNSELGTRNTAFLCCALAQLLLFLPIRPAPVFTRTYGQEVAGGGASLTPTAADREAGELVVAEMKAAEGDVLSENLGLMILAGKRVVYDPFQFTQLARLGKWNDSAIVEKINRREFGLVLLTKNLMEFPEPSKDHTGALTESPYFTPGMLRAIAAHYQTKRMIAQYYIMVPRS
ncbi:MAG: hypothetical protein NTX50_28020 [Candidatus Sumerlaeota bacterium]|nr:hypothetical protein [Candidatus Sumerlaeota bacterium]